MNKNSRLLPQLTKCFLQKKAYDVHRKKIDYIRQSLQTSICKKETGGDNHSGEKGFNCRSSNKMSTIREEVGLVRYERVSPWEKRRRQESQLENLRLIKRIQTCSSTIKRKEIEDHMTKSKEILNRIRRFKTDPGTRKSELKSVHSMNVLARIKERNDCDMTSRRVSLRHSGYRQSKSLVAKSSGESLSQISQQSKSLLGKKNSVDKFINRRNSLKVKMHFGHSEFAERARVKLNALRQHNTTQVKRRKLTESSEYHSKSRCFTTELQNYH